MREALPKTVPFDDAASNLARVALGVAGMAGRRTDLLRYLTVDRLHEPYRAEVYPQLPRLVEAAREAGALGACLSGSGSAVIAFTDTVAAVARIEAAFSAVAADTDLPGQATVVTPRNAGAKVVHRGLIGRFAGPIRVDSGAPWHRARRGHARPRRDPLDDRADTAAMTAFSGHRAVDRQPVPERSTRSATPSRSSSTPSTSSCRGVPGLRRPVRDRVLVGLATFRR